MAKYRVKTLSFINNRLCNEGEVVDYDGIPSDNLEPMDAAGEAAASKTAAAAAEDIARQKAAAVGADPDLAENVALVSAAATAAAGAIASAGLV